MTPVAVWVLVLSLAWLVYTYFGYPLVLYILARLRPGPDRRDDDLPRVTIITAAFNEERAIGETVANKLQQDYPEDRFDIIVVSDGSSDATDAIVDDIARDHPGRVRLIRQLPRQGKTAGLNLAVREAQGEILVFADANSLYEESALRYLVSNFHDPAVGYVTGKMIYTNPDGSVVGDGCTAYMKYENMLRAWETRVGSVVGVDGGIDAVRAALYRPMNADQLPDFVLPLSVVEQGYRVVYEPRALLREPALSDAGQEYRMRVRVTLRALWALYDLRGLFNPFRHTLFSWQLTSHKLLRYMAFLPQVLALVANGWLVREGGIFPWLFGGQVVFYALAAVGYSIRNRAVNFPLATLPYYFSLLNFSCSYAFVKFLRGEKQVLWQPRTG